MKVLLAVLALLLLPADTLAATFYADAASTRQTQPCTRALPCQLEYAVGTTGAGNDLVLLDGTYTLENPLMVPNGIEVHGDAGTRPVIQGGGIYPSGGAGATRLHDLELRGGGTGVVLSLTQNVTASNLVVRTSTASTAIIQMFGNAVLRDSVVHNNGANSATIQTGGNPPPNVAEVRNVTIHSTGAGAVAIRAVGSSMSNAGCTVTHAALLVSNSIVRGTAGDLQAFLTNAPGCTATSKLTVRASNYRTATSQGGATLELGPGNQTDPAQTDDAAIFADSARHQRPSSPTVDAGESLPAPTADLDGDARPGDGAPDIGADEIPGAPTATTANAVDVTASSARVVGFAAPNAFATQVVFDYGPTSAYGTSTAPQTVAAAQPYSALLTGLPAGSVVHYRVRAYNTGGLQPREAAGADATLTTQPAPSPSPTPTPAPTPVAGPLLVRLAFPSAVRLRTFRRSGLRGTVVTGLSGAAFDVRLTARIRGRTVVLGTAHADALAAGSRSVSLRPGAAARRRLARLRTLSATLRIALRGPGATPVVRTQRVRLTR